MKTRAILALSAILAAGLSAGVADAAARKPVVKIPACPVFADPAKDDFNGDTSKAPGGSLEDPALDIVKTAVTAKAGMVTVKLTMSKLGDPSSADGVQYAGGFTAGGKAVELFGTRSRTSPVVGAAFAINGINVDGEYVSGTNKKVTLTEDAGTNTATLTAALADVEAAVGTKLAPKSLLGGLQSNTTGTYGVLLEPYDTSEAVGLKLPVGDCK